MLFGPESFMIHELGHRDDRFFPKVQFKNLLNDQSLGRINNKFMVFPVNDVTQRWSPADPFAFDAGSAHLVAGPFADDLVDAVAHGLPDWLLEIL